MTTYTTITDAISAAGAAVTQSLMRRLRDNPLAMAEQSAGAPRFKQKVQSAAMSVGSTQVFTDISDWQGIVCHIGLHNASGAATRALTLAISDDSGSTIETETILDCPTSSDAYMTFFFDFSSGVVTGSYMVTGAVGLISATFTDGAINRDALNWMRFTTASDLTASILIFQTGGAV